MYILNIVFCQNEYSIHSLNTDCINEIIRQMIQNKFEIQMKKISPTYNMPYVHMLMMV